MNTFEPLYDNILVKPISQTSKIIIVEVARGVPTFGEVVAVGNGYRTETGIQGLYIRVGDKVLFRQGDGAEITVGKDKLLVMKEAQVLGKVGT